MPIEGKCVFKIYFSYIINMTVDAYVGMNSEMKQKNPEWLYTYSATLFFLSESKLNS
jgi:hypothetical protein